jgi:hypothetical protein
MERLALFCPCWVGEIMATYHGIVEVRCLSCDRSTREVWEMEALNDLDALCECGARFRLWVNEDGTRCVTLEGDNQDVQRLEYKG